MTLFLKIVFTLESLWIAIMGLWTSAILRPDPIIMEQFSSVPHYPFPLLVMIGIGAEIVILHWIWFVFGKGKDNGTRD